MNLSLNCRVSLLKRSNFIRVLNSLNNRIINSIKTISMIWMKKAHNSSSRRKKMKNKFRVRVNKFLSFKKKFNYLQCPPTIKRIVSKTSRLTNSF